jgi:hypothetical protein
VTVYIDIEPPSASSILKTLVTLDKVTGHWLEGRDWISCMVEIFSLYTLKEAP